MALLPVIQQPQEFKRKSDNEGKWLSGLQALGGTIGAAGTMTGNPIVAGAGGVLAGAASLRAATRPTPTQGSYEGGTSGAPLVAMQNRVDAMKADPYAQMVQARNALDYLDLDPKTRMEYARPLDQAMYAYQQKYNRGSV